MQRGRVSAAPRGQCPDCPAAGSDLPEGHGAEAGRPLPSPKDLADDWSTGWPTNRSRPIASGCPPKRRGGPASIRRLVVSTFGLVVAAAIALAVSTVLIKKQQVLTEAARQEAVENAAGGSGPRSGPAAVSNWRWTP